MRRPIAAVLLVALAAGCSDGDASPGTTVTTTMTTPAPTPIERRESTFDLPGIEVPPGILAAVPQQDREDVVRDQFQVQLVNGTGQQLHVIGLRFAWDGFTTERADRDDTVVAGQRINFPLPFPGAECVGDGGQAQMPDIGTATVHLWLADGSERDVPAVDRDGVGRRLYLRDCERQQIAAAVRFEWVDFQRVDLEGRPVTAARLQVTRLAAEGEVVVVSIGDTIPYRVVLRQPGVEGTPVVTLAEGETEAFVDVWFVEARCDAHALAETKQPFKFVMQVDLGDHVLHPYVLMPPVDQREPMRTTSAEACDILDENHALG